MEIVAWIYAQQAPRYTIGATAESEMLAAVNISPALIFGSIWIFILRMLIQISNAAPEWQVGSLGWRN